MMKRQLWPCSPLWCSLAVLSRGMALNIKKPARIQVSHSSSPLRHYGTPLTVRPLGTSSFPSLSRAFSSDRSHSKEDDSFTPGDKIQVEVVSFGPLGASVEVIGKGHAQEDIIPPDEDPLATGLILQKEISYFRQARNNVDVVRGEILPAVVQNVREDGKLDIGLRSFGGKAKAKEVGDLILK